jgi:hypothetical protein
VRATVMRVPLWALMMIWIADIGYHALRHRARQQVRVSVRQAPVPTRRGTSRSGRNESKPIHDGGLRNPEGAAAFITLQPAAALAWKGIAQAYRAQEP